MQHSKSRFIRHHIRRVRECAAVTCHLYFGQNGGDLLRPSAVTREWKEYRNESAQTFDPEKENAPAGTRT